MRNQYRLAIYKVSFISLTATWNIAAIRTLSSEGLAGETIAHLGVFNFKIAS